MHLIAMFKTKTVSKSAMAELKPATRIRDMFKFEQRQYDYYSSRPYCEKIKIKLKDEMFPRTYSGFNVFDENNPPKMNVNHCARTGLNEKTNIFHIYIPKEFPLESFDSTGHNDSIDWEKIENITFYVKNAQVYSPKITLRENEEVIAFSDLYPEKITIKDETDNSKYKSIPVSKFTGLKGFIDLDKIAINRISQKIQELGIDPSDKAKISEIATEINAGLLSLTSSADVKKIAEELKDEIELE